MSGERKFVGLVLDEVEPDGVFSGYASLFGAVDLGKDVVEKGAFAASLKARGAAGIRMLFQHDPAEPIGVWTEIREDARGLFVRGTADQGRGAGERGVVADARRRARRAVDRLSGGQGEERSEERRAPHPGGRPLGDFGGDLPDAARRAHRHGEGRGHPGRAAADDTRIRKLAHAGCGADARRGPGGDRQGIRQPGARAGRRAGSEPYGQDPRGDTHDDEHKTMGNDTMTEHNLARAPDTKSAGNHAELADAFDEFMTTFEAFKDGNDRRLARTGKQGRRRADGREGRPHLEGARRAEARHRQSFAESASARALDRGGRAVLAEHKQAFDAYMRSGDDRLIRALDTKAMSYGSGQDGGYLVPDETEAEIGKRLEELSPIRSIASVRQVSAAVLKKPFSVTGPAVGWVAETAARPQTNIGDACRVVVPDDGALRHAGGDGARCSRIRVVDLDQWISSEVEAAFAEQEGTAFVAGDGSNKPKGFLDYTKVSRKRAGRGARSATSRPACPARCRRANPSDVLIDYGLCAEGGLPAERQLGDEPRRPRPAIRKLKDADGNYLWQPPAAAGSRAMLMGFPLVEAEDMPDAGANTTPIAFGDFAPRLSGGRPHRGARAARPVFRKTLRAVLHDQARRRRRVQDFDAIKLLKYGTCVGLVRRCSDGRHPRACPEDLPPAARRADAHLPSLLPPRYRSEQWVDRCRSSGTSLEDDGSVDGRYLFEPAGDRMDPGYPLRCLSVPRPRCGKKDVQAKVALLQQRKMEHDAFSNRRTGGPSR